MSLFGNILGGLASAFGGNDITWYCDGCNSILNNQPGFNTDSGTWECTECGYENDVTSSNVYSSEEEYQEQMGIPRCPSCGGMVRGDASRCNVLVQLYIMWRKILFGRRRIDKSFRSKPTHE